MWTTLGFVACTLPQDGLCVMVDGGVGVRLHVGAKLELVHDACRLM